MSSPQVWLSCTASAQYEGCARQPRVQTHRPELPCDLVRNTFCDTSGGDYPWAQLRKFVYENQGLIKRMYGYQTHYTIFKEEVLDALQDGGHLYDPLEMYLPEHQRDDSQDISYHKKNRNSIRSNAFRQTMSNFPVEPRDLIKSDNGRFDFDVDQGFEAELRSARHLDSRSSSGRVMDLSSSPRAGRRSIAATGSIINNPQSNKPQLKSNLRGYTRPNSVRITQGYSSQLSALRDRIENDEDDERSGGNDTVATEDGAVSMEGNLAITTVTPPDDGTPSTSTAPSNTFSATRPTTPGSSARTTPPSIAPTTAASASPITPSHTTPTRTIPTQTAPTHATIPPTSTYTAAPLTPTTPPVSTGTSSQEASSSSTPYVVPDTEQYSPDSGSTSATEQPGRPLETDEWGTLSSIGADDTSQETSMKAPPSGSRHLTEGEAVTETFTSTTDVATGPVQSGETTEATTSFVSAEDATGESVRAPEEESTTSGEVLSSHRSPEGRPTLEDLQVEMRTSAGIELTERDQPMKGRPDHFKFPDQVDSKSTVTKTEHGHDRYKERQQEHSKQQQQHDQHQQQPTRRHTNTRRPASAESHNTVKSIGGGGEQRDGTGTPFYYEETRPQATWRRPDSSVGVGRNDATTIPAPPTPSTVPTPSHTVHLNKGINACPVESNVVAPYWANNTRGEVLALLNLAPFEQYVHWEKCRFEYRQMYCRSGCRCEQQYRLHRMLAFDPSNDCRGIFSDWFRFPSGCICRCYDIAADTVNNYFQQRSSPAPSTQSSAGEDLTINGRESKLDVSDRQGRQRKNEDLTDVYFETEDDLLYLNDEAQERMDLDVDERDMYSEETEPEVYRVPYQKDGMKILSARNEVTDDLIAVLEGEPVHSLYSRVVATQNKPKVTVASITPQRRPRVRVIGQGRSGLSRSVVQSRASLPVQRQQYKVRFSPSSRVLQFAAPRSSSNSNTFHQFQPSTQFNARSRYYENRKRLRSMNSWNPQASFPSTLSNPRFHKYLEAPQIKSSSVFSNFGEPNVPSSDGSHNLNFQHLMKPAAPGPVTPVPEGVSPLVTVGTVDTLTPHYFFNLTSHLIRTQELDTRRQFRGREPRSVGNAEEMERASAGKNSD